MPKTRLRPYYSWSKHCRAARCRRLFRLRAYIRLRIEQTLAELDMSRLVPVPGPEQDAQVQAIKDTLISSALDWRARGWIV